MPDRKKPRPASENHATLEEVGAALGLTRERVRQLEKSALQKVRAACEERGIDEHYWLGYLADLDRLNRTQYHVSAVEFVHCRIIDPDAEETADESAPGVNAKAASVEL